MNDTYFKLQCQCCARETPHWDNSTTLQCAVCGDSNPIERLEVYEPTELATFWRDLYFDLMKILKEAGIKAGRPPHGGISHYLFIPADAIQAVFK
ncbi:MAG TPA: hypothetical protein VFT58_06630 [Nitrososphaera sp.]|nr:hypothetical protein [Nitrososphaera sp.]